MAETDKKTESKSTPAKASLGRASESGDPAVHQILAERQTATLNGDEAAVKDCDRRLAELGYE